MKRIKKRKRCHSYKIGKHASLNLSINAIVVLILAVTMLGLGLGFIRRTFTRATSGLETIQEDIKNQIIADIQSSDERLAFDKYDVTVKAGDPRTVYFGVKNDIDTTANCKSEFRVMQAECITSLSGTEGTTGDVSLQAILPARIGGSQVGIGKLIIETKSDTQADTYSCRLDISKEPSPPDCGIDQGITSYADRDFFITVE